MITSGKVRKITPCTKPHIVASQSKGAAKYKNGKYRHLTLFSMALCDDHTPRAMSLAAFYHNLSISYPN